jgi:hypothetical protein
MVYASRRLLCLFLSMLVLAMEDSHAQSFVPTGSMMAPRYANSAILLQDGRVLIAGGENELAAASAEIYDPVSGTFCRNGRSDPEAELSRGGVIR